MGRKTQYDFERIEAQLEKGASWKKIATSEGKAVNTIRTAYYRWLRRNAGVKPKPKKKRSYQEQMVRAQNGMKPDTKITGRFAKKMKASNGKKEEISKKVGSYIIEATKNGDIAKYLEENNKFPSYINDSDTLRQIFKLITGKGSRDRIDVVKMKIIAVLLNSLDKDLQNLFKAIKLSE
jgi:hypothetical protein